MLKRGRFYFYLNISGVSFQVHVKVSLKGERMHRYKEKIGGEKKENLLSLLAQKIISPWNWKKRYVQKRELKSFVPSNNRNINRYPEKIEIVISFPK